MPTISRSRAVLYVAVALALLALGGRVLLARGDGAQPAPQTLSALKTDSAPAAESAEKGVATRVAIETVSAELIVHVVGAVRKPGLYRLAAGSRIDDAIRKAGGPTGNAKLALINLAASLTDGEQIVVPARGDVVSASGAGSPWRHRSEAAAPVHLNTATLEQLDSLPGIGPVTAQNILQYREEHGSFTSVDELDAVPGIGPARLDQLRQLVEP